MKVETLFSVATRLASLYGDNKLSPLFDNLLRELHGARDNPGEDRTQQVQAAFRSARKVLDRFNPLELSPAERAAYAVLDPSGAFGSPGAMALQSAVTQPFATRQAVIDAVQALRQRAMDSLQVVQHLQSGLTHYTVERPSRVPPDASDDSGVVTMVFDRDCAIATLSDLLEALRSWKFIIGAVSGTTSTQTGSARIYEIQEGSLEIGVLLAALDWKLLASAWAAVAKLVAGIRAVLANSEAAVEKSKAEAEKFRAEAEKLRAEGRKLDAESHGIDAQTRRAHLEADKLEDELVQQRAAVHAERVRSEEERHRALADSEGRRLDAACAALVEDLIFQEELRQHRRLHESRNQLGPAIRQIAQFCDDGGDLRFTLPGGEDDHEMRLALTSASDASREALNGRVSGGPKALPSARRLVEESEESQSDSRSTRSQTQSQNDAGDKT